MGLLQETREQSGARSFGDLSFKLNEEDGSVGVSVFRSDSEPAATNSGKSVFAPSIGYTNPRELRDAIDEFLRLTNVQPYTG